MTTSDLAFCDAAVPPDPSRAVITGERWRQELRAFLRHGAVVYADRHPHSHCHSDPESDPDEGQAVGADDAGGSGAQDLAQGTGNNTLADAAAGSGTVNANDADGGPGYTLRVRWPLTARDLAVLGLPAGEPVWLSLRVRFLEGYPWLPAPVQCLQPPAWLVRHCHPVDGTLCLTGSGERPGGLDGGRDHDPSLLAADWISRQLPRVLEANGGGAPAAGLEDQVGEGLSTWLPRQAALTLLLDTAQLPPETETRGAVLVTVLHSSPSVLVWLGAAICCEGRPFSVPAALLPAVRHPPVPDADADGSGVGTQVAVGSLLALRMMMLPWVRLPLHLTPQLRVEQVWQAAQALLSDDQLTLFQGSDALLLGGCVEAVLVFVVDEVAHRKAGWTPTLLVRTRRDRRRRWRTAYATVQAAGPTDLAARHPHTSRDPDGLLA